MANLMFQVDGFIGRATLVVDLVSLALVPVLILMTWSLYEVRYRKNYELHKRIMVVLSLVLLVAILVFEVDIRQGWTDRAKPSPYYEDGGGLFTLLYVHLSFSVTTTVLWIVIMIRALRNFPKPAAPSAHSRFHVRWARITAIGMYLTVLTGWLFYYFAFVA